MNLIFFAKSIREYYLLGPKENKALEEEGLKELIVLAQNKQEAGF